MVGLAFLVGTVVEVATVVVVCTVVVGLDVVDSTLEVCAAVVVGMGNEPGIVVRVGMDVELGIVVVGMVEIGRAHV